MGLDRHERAGMAPHGETQRGTEQQQGGGFLIQLPACNRQRTINTTASQPTSQPSSCQARRGCSLAPHRDEGRSTLRASGKLILLSCSCCVAARLHCGQAGRRGQGGTQCEWVLTGGLLAEQRRRAARCRQHASAIGQLPPHLLPQLCRSRQSPVTAQPPCFMALSCDTAQPQLSSTAAAPGTP